MEVIPCTDNISWDEWAEPIAGASFLQSWEWGEFQRSVGHEPIRVFLKDAGKIIDGFQGFFHTVGMGITYLYVPGSNRDVFEHKEVINFLKTLKVTFVRVEAAHQNTGNDFAPAMPIGVSPTKARQPQQTILLDLSQPQDALLSEMHTKTRYNIRLAEKKGVHVIEEQSADVFWQLMQETAGRGAFRSHDLSYYQAFLKLSNVHQVTAYVGDQPAVSNLCLSFGDTFVYVHGASSSKYRAYMAPYLVQWRTIEHAKALGFKYYDMWGVAPQVPNESTEHTKCFHNYCWDDRHRFAGITRFKVGFGGLPYTNPDPIDIVFKSVPYKFYKLIHRLRHR